MTEKTVNQSLRVKKAKGRFLKDTGVAIATGFAAVAFSAATIMTVTSGAGEAIDQFLPKKGENGEQFVSAPFVSSSDSSAEKGILAIVFGAGAALSGLGAVLTLNRAMNSSERLRMTKTIVAQEYEAQSYERKPNP